MDNVTPFFFAEEITEAAKEFILNEESSKHAVQVLRMQAGEQLLLTDGKGNVFTGEIRDNNKRKCLIKIIDTSLLQRSHIHITIAISLIKNTSRFEWFLEKATEIGVSKIVPLVCARTEKQHFRFERMRTIIVSAMLQSQQAWLPLLSEPSPFNEFIGQSFHQQKYIAHCIDEERKKLIDYYPIQPNSNQLIIIGPEGDFTKEEVDNALRHNYHPVSLGQNRLRTETAGIVACTLLNWL